MQYRYSIYGWVLVSAVVEAAAAEPFPKFMRREVFQPRISCGHPTEFRTPAYSATTLFFGRFVRYRREVNTSGTFFV